MVQLAFSKPTTDEDREKLFCNFHAVGYHGLQLKAGQYRDCLGEPQRFLDEWGAHDGVAAGLITAGGVDGASLEALQQVVRFASSVGSDLVIYCIGGPREGMTNADIANTAHALSPLGREAADLGVKLSIHNHFDSPVMHPDDLAVFFDAAEPGALGLTVDTAHLAKSGETDIAGIIRQFAGVIDNFHLKDFARGEWQVLGRGDIDFGPIFAAIGGISYDGWVSCDEESGSDLLPAMQECYRFMRAGLSGA